MISDIQVSKFVSERSMQEMSLKLTKDSDR